MSPNQDPMFRSLGQALPVAIQVHQHVVLPLVALLAGWAVVCWIGRQRIVNDRPNRARVRWILLILLATGIGIMGWMVTARYVSWHSFVFDLGEYDQKVWLIAHQATLKGMWQQTYRGGVHASPCGTNWYWGICHFQPWLLIPSLIYKVWDSPLVLLWLQVLLVVSGVVPVSLLARDSFNSDTAGVLAGILYLLYPAVQYNGVVDFRPDHVAIPTLLWAYLLAARGHYLAALEIAGLGALAKETLILNTAFFGLYLVVRHKQMILGSVAFLVGMVVFYIVTFHLLQFKAPSEGQFMTELYFPDLPTLAGGTTNRMRDAGSLVQHLTQAHKLLYLEALFVPLAFLPLLAPLELIPALPSLAMSLLSVNPQHASIDAQYSASIVAPAFAALLVAVARLRARFPSGIAPVPVLTGVGVISLVVSFGLGPTPLSRNFWDLSWGGRWYEAQYRPDRQELLNRAARLIPTDPKAVVVTQNDVNSNRLAHRYDYFAFPNALDRADYVLLDAGRQPYVYWMWNPRQYQVLERTLRADLAYQVVFDQKGVTLFKRREAPFESQ